MERSNPKSWVVTLTPNRSLSRRGFIGVMSLIAGLNFVAGMVFYIIGAWPVAGFCGLDVLLVWWAFRANFADARRAERIEITETELILDGYAKGREYPQQRFNRRWVRVELQEDEERELVGGLFLRSHGLRTEIGRFLAPDERKTLARELRAELA
jgi:uncharacterized membrane protein